MHGLSCRSLSYLPPQIERTHPAGLTAWQHLLVFALVAGAIYSRRPDALLNPQFYAEDGSAWSAEAWNLGWLHSLTLPAGGYLNTLPRLVCGLAILIPLKSAPLLLNLVGIAIQALPVNILLTSRCSNWGPLWIRGLQAALYVGLPNSREIHVTVTNAHWHLAPGPVSHRFSNMPHSWAWRLFDVIVLLLVGLTGPWGSSSDPACLVFLVAAASRGSLIAAALLAVRAVIQAAELLIHSDLRPTTPLGATLSLFPPSDCRTNLRWCSMGSEFI